MEDEGHQKVALEKELSYIDHYIQLQKLRTSERNAITFDFSGSVEGLLIAPMILLPFVENAFKYGINPDFPSKIDISIDVIAGKLQMVVKNDVVNLKLESYELSGIGMKNTYKRLELIYPGNHTLEFVKSDKSYQVTLNINL